MRVAVRVGSSRCRVLLRDRDALLVVVVVDDDGAMLLLSDAVLDPCSHSFSFHFNPNNNAINPNKPNAIITNEWVRFEVTNPNR